MELRRCSHCKEEKPLSEFTKDRRNKDGLNKYCRACKKLYNDVQRSENARHRALVFGGIGTFTKRDIEDCLDFFNHECAYSGVPLTKGYSLDHVAPLSKGGANEIHNIVPCLDIINIRKARHDWERWYVEQPYYSETRHAKIKQWIDMREGA